MNTFDLLRVVTHYGLHFIFPGIIAYLFFKNQWKEAWFIFVATMLVDLDHLLATPIFDPNRASIGFHPLHSYPAIGAYVLLFFFPKTRLVALGLLLHMATDFQDFFWI
ncbi:hypothetical protein DID80_05760 [Candidatus Marinamargulisbacteria bacterium SCGC AAA071-K20]|nr:hypothetical protein DID80_05760 [Candidatus Marinamargulisbacteria bacterium SCGC AAA071-K20]